MPSIPQLDTCCCGCSLKTGSKIIGWLHLVGSIIMTATVGSSLAFFYYIVDHPEIHNSNADEIRENFLALKLSSIMLIILYLAYCALGFVLLLGVYQNKAKLVLVWVTFSLAVSCLEVLISFAQFIVLHQPNILLNVLPFFINLYLILVVYSFYREITNISNFA